jgi:hypothetical protein
MLYGSNTYSSCRTILMLLVFTLGATPSICETAKSEGWACTRNITSAGNSRKFSLESRSQQLFSLQRWTAWILIKCFLTENQRILALPNSRTRTILLCIIQKNTKGPIPSFRVSPYARCNRKCKHYFTGDLTLTTCNLKWQDFCSDTYCCLVFGKSLPEAAHPLEFRHFHFVWVNTWIMTQNWPRSLPSACFHFAVRSSGKIYSVFLN